MSNDERLEKHVAAGRVRRVCQDWQVLEDEGFAHQLQNDEINEHYDRNRQNSRLIRDDFHAARREQLTEQQLVEYARRQEELEAEELAAQLAQLLDEEKHEEESQRRDEELARRIAQEEDELIAQEQQDRELARMLQAKERLKAKKLREARRLAEARRRQQEEVEEEEEEAKRREHMAEVGEEYSDEALNEALYANVGPPLSRHPDAFGNSSIYLLRNSDVVNPTRGTGGHQGSGSSASSRSSRNADSNSRSNSSTPSTPVARDSDRKNAPRKFAQQVDNEGDIPPYMPMQGLANRAAPVAALHPAASGGLAGHAQDTHKKNSSCKTQ